MNKTIALIPGDGIGPDVVAEAVNVLNAVADKYGHHFEYKNVIAGGCAIDKFGKPQPLPPREDWFFCLRFGYIFLRCLKSALPLLFCQV